MSFPFHAPFSNLDGDEEIYYGNRFRLDLSDTVATLRAPDDENSYPVSQFAQDQTESGPSSNQSVWTDLTEYVTSLQS